MFTKSSFRVIRASFLISFFYNVIGLSFAVTASLSPLIAAILMPISSITIVAFATFSVRLLGQKKLG
jgi:Cu+-exporting ATPase